MKTLITTSIILMCCTIGHSQCDFNYIFPVNHGITKFDAANKIATIKNIVDYDSPSLHKDFFNYWYKFNNKQDSVYKSSLFYEYKNTDCFKGKENTLTLYFVDDKLYKFLIIIEFNKDEYNKCLDNYNSLIKTLQSRFDFSEPFYLTNRNDEKTGEGMYLSDSFLTYDNAKEKNILISVNYSINFDYSTEAPKGYTIRLRYENKTGTIFEN